MERDSVPNHSAADSQITRCLHCNSLTVSGNHFCCSGCQTAYYALPEHAANAPASSSQNLTAYVQQNKDNHYETTLMVKGLHCASCIQLIENALHNAQGVLHARVNLSTERLTIEWKGTQEHINNYADIVEKLGYHVSPYNPKSTTSSFEHEIRFILRCIAIAGFAAGNIMLLSIGLWSTDGLTMGIATRDLFHWISATIALPAIFYAGQPFFRSAFSVLKQGHTNMDVPISLAIILASIMSLSETIHHGEYVYFDSALMLIFFLLIGRYLDMRAKGKARQSAQDLLSMLHGTATVIHKNNTYQSVPISELREDMHVLVAAGETIPADGLIIHGESELDMSLITGETIPQHTTHNMKVFAGTINISAPLTIRITKASEDSLLSDIVKYMEKAEQGQARYVRLADKAAQLYTPIVHSLGLITFLAWWLYLGQPWQTSLLNAITVLIITCPCALGLAVPVVQILASTQLMKQGILLKSGDALERLATIDTAIFDKTGTLTYGKPTLCHKQTYTKEHIQYARSLAIHSKHPLSIALVEHTTAESLPIQHIKEHPGKGIEATLYHHKICLGSRAWCGDKTHTEQPQLELWLAIDDIPTTCFLFEDSIREDAAATIDTFKHHAINNILLSGDRISIVEQYATLAHITHYKGEMTPLEKLEYITHLQQQRKHVLMVGDGLNDAPALAAANISISPSTAMDITQNTADIVFQGKKLSAITYAWYIAKSANRLVKQNFGLTILYNLIAIPLAVMGHVTPMVAAIAMSSSSLIVIGNSFRLYMNKHKKMST